MRQYVATEKERASILPSAKAGGLLGVEPMDLSNVDINNTEAVKALQSVLKAQGYYAGPIDGKWGGATTEAAARLRDAQQQAATQAAEDRRAQAGAEIARAEAEKAKARADEVKGGAGTKLADFATNTGPYAGGLIGGLLPTLDRTSGSVRKLADAVESGRINPVVAEQQLNKLLVPGSSTRNVAQFALPAGALALGEFTREKIAPSMGDYREYGIAAGNLETGMGVGSALAMAKNIYNQNKKTNPIDEARIRSAALPPDVPPQNPGGGGGGGEPPYIPISHADRAKAAYKAAGGKGSVTKAQAIEWLETPGNVTKANRAAVVETLGQGAERNLPSTLRILKGTGKYVIPALVAGSVADATYNNAKASGMSDTDAERNAAIDASVTGLGVGGGMYAANRLLPNVSGKIVGRLAAPISLAYDAYKQYNEPNPEDQPFTRRANAAMSPSSIATAGTIPAVAATNVLMNEIGAGTIDEHLGNFIRYMQGQGGR